LCIENFKKETMKSIFTFIFIIIGVHYLSSQGIKLVSDISQGEPSTFLNGIDKENGIIGNIDETVYFYAFKNDKYKIWSTQNGTQTVKVVFEEAVVDLPEFLFVGNRLFFVADYEKLYVIENGQNAKLLLDNNEYTTSLTTFKNELYFINNNTLKRYNQATAKIDNIFTFDSFGGVRDMTPVGDKLMIIGSDTDGDTKIFNSTGEVGGTIPFYTLNTGSEFSRDLNMTAVGSKCYFWYHPNNDPYNLYVTDGTEGGTKLLKGFKNFNFEDLKADRSIIPYKGKLFFRGDTDEKGDNLYVSDGTEAGTTMFYNPNNASDDSSPRDFYIYNDKLYFSAKNAFWNRSLHVYNGTNTEKVNLSNFKYFGDDLTSYNGKLIFSGSKEFDIDEIFISNGTNAGTSQLTFGSTSETSFLPYDITPVKNNIYFIGRKKETGTELYYYDPTLTGINNVEVNKFTLSPNPATTTIKIALDRDIELNETEMYIYGINADLLTLKTVKNNTIEVSDLATGIYSFSIKANNTVYKGRFVKQ
jgi:ELWxxDGT repeat protein